MPRKKKHSPTDEVTFTIRLDRGTRDAFHAACKGIDTTSSRELRAHMKKFIAKYGQDTLF